MNQNDKKWQLYNKELLMHAQKANWGLYRNTRFDMAEFLRKENKLANALETFLEIMYLDLNGPENRESIINNPELLKEFPQFDPKTAFLAPGVIDRVKKIAKILGFQMEKIREIFTEHNKKIEKALKLSLSTEECWKLVEKELKNCFVFAK